jgi:hypothetical protein
MPSTALNHDLNQVNPSPLRWLSAVAVALLFTTLAVSAGTDPAEDADYSAWAVDPTAPGPDLPPTGRSLFDHLTFDRASASYRIEFPFWSFVDRIRERLAQQEYAGGTRATLVPLGRSLQRAAAAPEFFMFPRAVVAITGEPLTSAHDTGMLLRDRLYIGYVEKTNTLEVVSYNEAAGRFEFQLVKDYRAGGNPQVVYANRAICTSCHQNQAPIFSAPVWSETTANGRVATLLGARLTALQLPRQSNLDFPDDINKAAVRANAIPPLQRAWRDGCAGAAGRSQAQRCRAAAFIAVLQYGLTGERDYDTASQSYRHDFIATSVDAWRTHWPQGMRVSQSDLPDRNPLGGATSTYASGADEGTPDWLAAVHVPAALDPLNLRPPREVWRLGGALDAPQLIRGWSKFFATDDFRALHAHLLQQRAHAILPQAVHRGECSITREQADGDLKIRCLRTTTEGVHLAAHAGARAGRIEWLDLGASGQLRDVEFEPIVERSGVQHVLRATAEPTALRARLPDGRSLARIEVRWESASQSFSAAPARITITITDDFAPVRDAVERLLAQDASVFDDAPLSRERLLRAVYAELGMPQRAWCCTDAGALPPPKLDEAQVDLEAAANPQLQPFFRHCSACHLTHEAFPPNFLSGNARQVEEQVRHCAPRMLVRLSAWQQAAAQSAKSPMPPAAAVQGLGLSLSQWKADPALEQMRTHLAALTRAQGRPVEIKALLQDGYEALPACLPSPAVASR